MDEIETVEPPPIPDEYTRAQEVTFWGGKYTITPAVAKAHLGDGKQLFALEPLNTRPNYYLVRIDSRWGKDPDDIRDHLDEIMDALSDEFSEKEREREYLIEDGVPEEDADLANYPDELGWPVLSLDSGYSWWTEADLGPPAPAPPA